MEWLSDVEFFTTDKLHYQWLIERTYLSPPPLHSRRSEIIEFLQAKRGALLFGADEEIFIRRL